eukprot:jgi/Ulvmu1/1720/UM116_0034.1
MLSPQIRRRPADAEMQLSGAVQSCARSCHLRVVPQQLTQPSFRLTCTDCQRTALSTSQDAASRIRLQDDFAHVDTTIAVNTSRVARAIRKQSMRTGLPGWESTLNESVAEIMGTDSAIASMRILSGTHAISAALHACLRPGDELFCASGPPYDTLEEVIGTRGPSGQGSLADFGVKFRCHTFPFDSNQELDEEGLAQALKVGRPKVCHIQRSCGYSLRPTLTISEVQSIIRVVREVNTSIIVSVDNCYGEFTEVLEPGHVGADVVMGSFIKNPGGTLAAGGGYIAGRKHIVNAVNVWWNAQPEIATEAQMLLQGLWLAPARVGEALKGGRLLAEFARQSSWKVVPHDLVEDRPSFITAIQLDDAQRMVEFCELVQQQSPVGSYIKPVPGRTPGYESKVIFADGTFIDGCTSELSADGPIRPPYVVYCQGGAHWTHWQNVVIAMTEKQL